MVHARPQCTKLEKQVAEAEATVAELKEEAMNRSIGPQVPLLFAFALSAGSLTLQPSRSLSIPTTRARAQRNAARARRYPTRYATQDDSSGEHAEQLREMMAQLKEANKKAQSKAKQARCAPYPRCPTDPPFSLRDTCAVLSIVCISPLLERFRPVLIQTKNASGHLVPL